MNRTFWRRAMVIAFTLAALLAARIEAQPRLKWAYETTGKIYASPILADLDGDGAVEIIVAASRDQRLLCLNGQGELLWSFQLEDGNSDGFQATPSVADYDGDGRQEVFWLTRGGTAGCVDYQGRLIWRVTMGDQMDYTGPVLADLNNDGRLEIVFGSESGTLYCLNDTGRVLWRRQHLGDMRGIPAVARIGDAPSMRVCAVFGGGVEACFDAEGNTLWAHEEGLPARQRRSGVSIGDLNGDGRLQTVSATEDFQVIARDAESGKECWRFKGKGRIDQTCSFALADFDGSGRLDVVTGDSSGHVYRLREGAAVWMTDTGGGVVQGPAVGDVNGDGRLNVLVSSRSKRLVCLDGDTGAIQWDFSTPAAPLTTPALGDVDGDGTVDIILTSKDRFVYCLNAGGKHDPGRLPWPMMNRDPQLSGNMRGAPFEAAPAPQAPETPPVPLAPAAFGPLRMGRNSLRFSFYNDSHRRRLLEAVASVQRPDGSVITHRVADECSPYETRAQSFELEALESGPYRLDLCLIDAGTGAILAEMQDLTEVNAFAVERAEAQVWHEEGAQLANAIGNEALRDRALHALAFAWDAADTALRAAEAAAHPDRRTLLTVRAAQAGLRRTLAKLYAAHATPGPADAFAAVPERSMRKVFMDEPYLLSPREAQPLRVELARNEYESAQLVLVPLWTPLRGLRVRPDTVRREDGGGAIPADAIQVHQVGYVEIGPPEYNWHVEKIGLYPDPLLPSMPEHIPAGQDAQPFFITVKTTADTPPGMYRGAVILEADGAAALKIPLEVKVWDFALPDKTTLKTSFWMKEEQIKAFYGYEGRTPFEVRKRYYDMHLDHRLGPLMALPLGGGDMLEDFEYVISRGQNNFFVHIPDLFGPEGRDEYREKVLATRALIQEKGWDDLVLFYTHDEVAVMARHLIPKVVEVNNWVKSFLPDWPRLQTSAPEQALVGAVDVWCPTIDAFNPELLATRMAQGDRLWFYTVWGRPGIMIEFPATDHRIMFWQCWKYGAEGFLYWGTTFWEYNITGDGRWPDRPWIPYNSQPGHNGCGYLIYPGPDGQPLSSLRLAMVRDGIEDYEMLHLLKTLLEQKRAHATETLRARAEAALAIAPEVVTDHKNFTEDPELILDARRQAAALIEELAGLQGNSGRNQMQ